MSHKRGRAERHARKESREAERRRNLVSLQEAKALAKAERVFREGKNVVGLYKPKGARIGGGLSSDNLLSMSNLDAWQCQRKARQIEHAREHGYLPYSTQPGSMPKKTKPMPARFLPSYMADGHEINMTSVDRPKNERKVNLLRSDGTLARTAKGKVKKRWVEVGLPE